MCLVYAARRGRLPMLCLVRSVCLLLYNYFTNEIQSVHCRGCFRSIRQRLPAAPPQRLPAAPRSVSLQRLSVSGSVSAFPENNSRPAYRAAESLERNNLCCIRADCLRRKETPPYRGTECHAAINEIVQNAEN